MFSRFPFWLYNTALIAGAPLWLGYYGLRRRQRPLRLHERFTYCPLSHAAPRIWLHSVSVGEVLAGQPLACALREHFPHASFVISTTTDTGQARAREQLAWMDAHFYFPLDIPWLTERAVTSLQPALVIILETEIWPNFLRTCVRHQVPVVLANGRLSDRSFARYRWLGRMMGDLLGYFRLCLMQSDTDAERIRQLGAPPERVLTTGNLKYAPPDADERARRDRIAAALQQQYHLGDGRPCIVAGSTVEGEEPILVEAFARLRAGLDRLGCRLLLAPRHPERFAEVARHLERFDWTVARRSQPRPEDVRAEVILLDTVGELAAAYRWADVAFVGGSLVPRGGHNILEPAAEGRPIVTGPHTENFRAILTRFRAADAVWQLPLTSPDGLRQELQTAFETLLRDPGQAAALGRRAQATWAAETGAVAATVAALKAYVFPHIPALASIRGD
ncbi:3-deoxy-D-manno-octulosonic acid transferase [Chloracidobacterium sp. D]|uniref:3-deoxy-D-manno-octulosonic acid transferase n=1 Tax=Chloracidobacterium sp. D TaxID=2821536 RepID=UPI001B8B2A05|nr:3-deoxy-D-manno-octulosonic acid transferase [Chloracidobacterium sp. D]QUV80730.1 3-deoxy-D-manno-octulosonic acid transferase [Chloracidobacterium sp. D]